MMNIEGSKDSAQRLYWAKRAENFADTRTVSIADPWQRDLEIEFVKTSLLATDEVLKVGCGNGVMSRQIYSVVSSLTSLDLSPMMISRAISDSQHLQGIDFRVGDASDLDFPDNSFDVIVCCRVLINMPKLATQMSSLSEFARVLRPEGRLILLEGRPEAFDALNVLRNCFELPNIAPAPVNLYLNDSFFGEIISRHFRKLGAFDSGLYDVLSRVLLPLLTDNLEDNLSQKFKSALSVLLPLIDSPKLMNYSRLAGGIYILHEEI